MKTPYNMKRKKRGHYGIWSNSNEYHIWRQMLRRCYNPKAEFYRNYGGRGIKVSEDWWEFLNFIRDMGGKPNKKSMIDRINNDGDYCKENCKWSTNKEQANNRTSNIMLTLNGETKNLGQWANFLGLKYMTLHTRIYRHKIPIERALTDKCLRRKNKTHCPSGHEYSGDNLRVTKYGNNVCKICFKAQKKKYMEKLKNDEACSSYSIR